MRFNRCIFLTFVSAIASSAYSQTTPSPTSISNDAESVDSSSTPTPQTWAAIIIAGLFGIVAVIIAADCVHKRFQSQYEDLMVDCYGAPKPKPKTWAQQPHLESPKKVKKPKPKPSAPKTADNTQKQSEKQKDKLVDETDTKQAVTQVSTPTKEEEEADAAVVPKPKDNDEIAVVAQTNEDLNTLVITKQTTDAAMVPKPNDNDELAVVEQTNEDLNTLMITKQVTDAAMTGDETQDETIEMERNDSDNAPAIAQMDEKEAEEEDNSEIPVQTFAFPDTETNAAVDNDDDIEIVVKEDSVILNRTPTPLDDPEIIIKASDDEEEEYSESTEEDVAVIGYKEKKEMNPARPVRNSETPVRETLESAWNLGASDDESGSEEDGDVMGDLASVRVEINRRVLNTLAPINDMETPQSTAL